MFLACVLIQFYITTFSAAADRDPALTAERPRRRFTAHHTRVCRARISQGPGGCDGRAAGVRLGACAQASSHWTMTRCGSAHSLDGAFYRSRRTGSRCRVKASKGDKNKVLARFSVLLFFVGAYSPAVGRSRASASPRASSPAPVSPPPALPRSLCPANVVQDVSLDPQRFFG